MSDFIRFPHTPHLVWLGDRQPRRDKVLTPEEARSLLSHELLVEEKVDGANLGLSVDERGTLRAQSRGAYLSLDEPSRQFKPLKQWLRTRSRHLAEALFPDLILFGEWCYAVHSVRYTRLPDWFLGFDVFDKSRRVFWSATRRDALLEELGLAAVPRRASGRFDLAGIQRILGGSTLTDGPAEGLYVRYDSAAYLVSRAKVVRPEFVQAIDEHWSKMILETNTLAKAASSPPAPTP